MSAALAIIGGFTLLALVLGVAARGGRDMPLEQWAVAGRGFGAVLVFMLLAGEIYTTFTFLGASGYAYGVGAPAFYIIAYGALAYGLSYYIMPPVWRHARAKGLISQPDYFRSRYASPALGVLVSIVDVVALVPYLVLQFKGLGIIVEAGSDGTVSAAVAVTTGALVVAAYVAVSGVRGSAWIAVVKDVGIVVVVGFLGIYLPWHYFGGVEAMFQRLLLARPELLALPAHGKSVSWFVSTVVLSALGFFMWPHAFAAVYTARSERALRRNAVVLPLYQLVLLLVYFVGFTAVLVTPGLKGAEVDLALFRIVGATFPPVVTGLVGGVGVLTALVPASMIVMSIATLLAQLMTRSGRDQAERGARIAKWLVPVIALAAAALALHGNRTIVALLLMGYSFVIQLFPALLSSLSPRPRVPAAAAMAGIVAGMAAVMLLSVWHLSVAELWPGIPAAWADLNVGVVALLANLVVMGLVALGVRLFARPELVVRSGS